MSFHPVKLFQSFSRHAPIYSQVCLCDHNHEKVTFLTQPHNKINIFYLQNKLENSLFKENKTEIFK